MTLTLARGATISGTISDATGAPVTSGAVVMLLDSDARHVQFASVAPDGTYSFADLPEGTYHVLVYHLTSLFNSVAVSVSEGQSATAAIAAVPGLVYGTVVDPQGAPVAGADVMLVATDPVTGQAHGTHTTTAGNGTYQIVGCPDGQVTMTMQKEGLTATSQIVIVVYGAQQPVDLAFVEGYQVSGTVTQEGSGTPIAGAAVYLLSLDTPLAPRLPVESDASGHWSIDRVAAGNYRVIVVAAGYALHADRVSLAGDAHLDTALTQNGFRIQGTVIDSVSGLPLADATVTLMLDGIACATTQSGTDGRFELARVASGTYTLRIAHGGDVSLVQLPVDGDVSVEMPVRACSWSGVTAVVAAASQGIDATQPSDVGPSADTGDDRKKQIAEVEKELDDANQTFRQACNTSYEPVPSARKPIPLPHCCITDPSLEAEYNRLQGEYRALAASASGLWWEKLLHDWEDGRDIPAANQEVAAAGWQLDMAQSWLLRIIGYLTALAYFGGTEEHLGAYDGYTYTELIEKNNWAMEQFGDELGHAKDHIQMLEMYTEMIAGRRRDFNEKVRALQMQIDSYFVELAQYEKRRAAAECKVPPTAPSVAATVCATLPQSVDLLKSIRPQLVGLSYSVRYRGGDYLPIDGQGWLNWSGEEECGSFYGEYELAINCGGGALGDKSRSRFSVTLNVMPELVCALSGPEQCRRREEIRAAVKACNKNMEVQLQCGNFDPNDISGPWGAGDGHWIIPATPMAYTIQFENDPERAGAPAQVVRITQMLDADLDWTTFRLGEIGFGSVTVDGAAGLSSYEGRLDLTQSLGIFVDVKAGIDLASGQVLWEFTSIDPDTGAVPADILWGFLPPNADGVEGQGFVSYSVKPKASLSTGARIDAAADIVFDVNDPLATPAIYNTVDAGTPTSQVSALPNRTNEEFLVQWSGQDDAAGSGVGRYDIYVSDDGGEFTLWQPGLTGTSAMFDGTAGHTYAFASIAHDSAGNAEAKTLVAEASTLVDNPPTISAFVIQDGQTQRTRIDRFAMRFSQDVNLTELIASGQITSAVRLVEIDGTTETSVSLSPGQFSYDAATFTLAWQGSAYLPVGQYAARLQPALIHNQWGTTLNGASKAPSFSVSQNVQADGADVQVTDYSVPALGDLNGDGRADMIVGEKASASEGKIRIYFDTASTGPASFGAYTYAKVGLDDLGVSAVGCLGAYPRVFDWNGDGLNDLVVGRADGQVMVFRNAGTAASPVFAAGTFIQAGPVDAKATIDVGDRAAPELVDWNNDGTMDLVVGAMDGRIRVYLNSASAGEPDLATAIVVQANGSDLLVPGGRSSVVVADLDGDGRKDLIVGNTEGQVLDYANTGTDAAPTFAGAVALKAGDVVIDLDGTPRSRLFVADMNGDGIPDLLVGSADGTVRLYNGIPTQQVEAATFAVVTPPTSQVSALPATAAQCSFVVNWSGQPGSGGSAIASYDIYVADDHASYMLWQDHVKGTSATFTGQVGHTYAFYSVACDCVDNIEDAPAVPDATVTILAADLLVNGTSLDDQITVRLSPSDSATLEIFVNVPTSGSPTLAVTLQALNTLTLDAGSGDDQVTLDLSNGSLFPAAGLYVDGGDGGDSLHVAGTASQDVSYTPSGTVAGEGSIGFSPQQAQFASIESLSFETFASVAVVTPNAADNLTVDRAPGGGTRVYGLSGGIPILPITVFNTGRVVVDAAASDASGSISDDIITVGLEGIDTVASARLEVCTGLGNDRVYISGGSVPLEIENSDNLDLIVYGGSATIYGNAMLAALDLYGSARVTLAGGGNQVLCTESLSMAASSRLNLKDNDLIVGTAALADVKALIRSGYNKGAWNGPGIYSDAIVAGRHGLGYAAGSDPAIAGLGGQLGGQPFDGDSVIVKYTYAGDANLDGAADFADLGWLLSNYGTGSDWTHGDFNYDWSADSADLALLLGNYGSSGLSAGAFISAGASAVALQGPTASLTTLFNRARQIARSASDVWDLQEGVSV